MTSEHYLREIAELLKEMNQRLARIEQEFTDPILYFDKNNMVTVVHPMPRARRPWWHDTEIG